MNSFKDIGIASGYLKGLEELGITEPTEIQFKAIPKLLGKQTDFIGQAQTGTGKTAAFGLPLLADIDHQSEHIQAVVVAPTRELAKQIQKQLFKFTKYTVRIFTEVVCGGDKIDRQIEALKRPTQVLVATPGRLMDLHRRRAVDLSHVRILVLDETDEMLKMGFRNDIESIIKLTKGDRDIWLFSATMPLGIKKMTSKYMAPDAPFLKIDKKNIVNPNIKHQFFRCTEDQKFGEIINYLERHGEDRGLIFCRTRADTIACAKALEESDVTSVVLHGDLMQSERDKMMRMFKKKRARVLVTTDVSARGIDVEGLAFVIHHKLPEKNDYYTHRSGRTGRAGKKGTSLAFITRHDDRKIAMLERQLGISFQELA